MRGHVGADTRFLPGKVEGGQQNSSVFVTIRNILFFSQPSAKFWTNLSENTAPLPPNINNYLNLKNKVSKKVGADAGAEWGQLGADAGQKNRGCDRLPPDLLLLFQGLDSQGAVGQSVKFMVNRFLWAFYQIKNRFSLVFPWIVVKVRRHKYGKGFGFLCDAFLSVLWSCVGWNESKVSGILTALSRKIRGKGQEWPNVINGLGWLDRGKGAVRSGFRGLRYPPPIKNSQGKAAPPPHFSCVNWMVFHRGLQSFSFVFEKWGARGEPYE